MYLPSNVNANCGIYRIVNKANGKFYIGSSKDLSERRGEHLRLLKLKKHPNDYLQKAFNKVEDKSVFEFQAFIFCKEEDLLSMEQSCMDIMKPEYNLSKIAGKIDHTPEVRAKMRKRKKEFFESEKSEEFRK